ncbi:MAG: universal stress protein [Gammaproteobacteria bacterium]
MLFEDILVVADRDDNRQLALRAALDLTRGSRARLSVVAFVHDPIVDEATLVSKAEARRMQARMLADKRDWLAGIVARHPVEGVTIRQQVAWTKDIAGWVNAEVAKKGHRLIVKSGHRSESLVHTPTDWTLLRQAPVPVMIVRDRLRKRPARVVAAVDLLSRDPKQQTLDRRVLGHAAAVARQVGAELHVVSAVPLSTLAHDLDLIDRALLERRSREKAAESIAALCREFDLPAERFTLKAGPPERVIDGVASKLKATLLVMGTVGRKGLRARLLGNTAEKVLHRNRSTVLAVRPG